MLSRTTPSSGSTLSRRSRTSQSRRGQRTFTARRERLKLSTKKIAKGYASAVWCVKFDIQQDEFVCVVALVRNRSQSSRPGASIDARSVPNFDYFRAPNTGGRSITTVGSSSKTAVGRTGPRVFPNAFIGRAVSDGGVACRAAVTPRPQVIVRRELDCERGDFRELGPFDIVAVPLLR
ncbi:hypothetical protein EVAR_12076_1 [Eumeta japonica]|uniref:Uncharacterized protein n=1 Tax=Eumeta variegata TaxID=151549 RepID=A0A4C1U502_EUMVA|nr:hypothetical protein EVAR_12076_1 [Eumeta japonica]